MLRASEKLLGALRPGGNGLSDAHYTTGRITYADGNHVKTWEVRGGKVTSEPAKGYYYFWARRNGKKFYVQTPIGRTYIEEIP